MSNIEAKSNPPGKIDLESIVTSVKDQVSSDLDGETVVLHITNGVYFSLNPVGAAIWKLIQEPRRVRELRDAILREYDVSEAACTADILKLLGDLAEAQLIVAQPPG